jgi:hypothetical protein
MNLAGIQRLTCSLPEAPPLVLTHNSTANRATSISSSGEPSCAGHTDRLVRLRSAPDFAHHQGHPHTDGSRSNLDSVT